jgi:hypothetical protein
MKRPSARPWVSDHKMSFFRRWEESLDSLPEEKRKIVRDDRHGSGRTTNLLVQVLLSLHSRHTVHLDGGETGNTDRIMRMVRSMAAMLGIDTTRLHAGEPPFNTTGLCYRDHHCYDILRRKNAT